MGVRDLWPILEPVGGEIQLTDLTGKKVAVDLGGWVVQSKSCKALHCTFKPHLKNLFYRVSYLLRNNVLPVFVIEGEVPEMKKGLIFERNVAAGLQQRDEAEEKASSRNKFGEVLQECEDMLKTLGVPCLKSSGEAEAYCAYLNRIGLVDGCVSNDNDSFLYGAKVVYRDFTIDQNYPRIREYVMDDIESKLQLDRRKLVALALLLGCDYAKGVPSIGRGSALKFLEELKDVDALERFKEWKELPESELFPSTLGDAEHCENCGHPGTSQKHQENGCDICETVSSCNRKKKGETCPCIWHENIKSMKNMKNELKVYQAAKKVEDFPDLKVVEEYLNYTDKVPNEESLKWTGPNLLAFQEGVDEWMHWTVAEALQKMLPVISAWQINLIRKKSATDTKEFLLQPSKISQLRVRKGEEFYEVKWTSTDETHNDVSLSTLERTDFFSEAYPDVTQEYLDLLKSWEESKEMKKKWKEEKKKQERRRAQNLQNKPPLKMKKVEVFIPSTAAKDPCGDVKGVSEQDALSSPTPKRSAEEAACGNSAKFLCVEAGDAQCDSEHVKSTEDGSNKNSV